MDPSLEIENARIWLSRISTVDDLIRFWMLYGPNRAYLAPHIEDVPTYWYDGLLLQ